MSLSYLHELKPDSKHFDSSHPYTEAGIENGPHVGQYVVQGKDKSQSQKPGWKWQMFPVLQKVKSSLFILTLFYISLSLSLSHYLSLFLFLSLILCLSVGFSISLSLSLSLSHLFSVFMYVCPSAWMYLCMCVCVWCLCLLDCMFLFILLYFKHPHFISLYPSFQTYTFWLSLELIFSPTKL